MEALLDRFQSYVAEHNICSPQDRILLTVSGGVDSMVMFSLFVRSGYRVGVAHCNFQLRGAESIEDEDLVRRMATEYGVPHYNVRFDTEHEMEQSGESVQMAARRLRYTWFEGLCREHGYDRIAIAHHADDSVETFLINLLRGTGLRGLTGISVINGRLIRPLLFSTRREIIDYAIANKISYREDSSNASTKYLRNKIRLGVIPRIREISPHFSETMTSNVERLTAAQSFIDSSMELIRNRVMTTKGNVHTIDPRKIDKLLPEQFVVYELLRSFGFNPEVIGRLYHSLKEESSGKQFYSRDYVAYLDRSEVIVMPIPGEDSCALSVDGQTRRIYCGGNQILFEHLEVDDVDTLHQPDNIAVVDEARLRYPLTVRRWHEGDSFVPFGMEGHGKKVSDFLIDNKVALPDKMRQFVVLSGEEIVWIVGRRVDERFRVGADTENLLRMSVEIDPS